jgi:hypothetical protein
MEDSLSMPELVAILEAKQKEENDNRRFLAAMQGVDLDKDSNSSNGQDAWERIKAKAFSGGKTTNPDDIVSLQGSAAQRAGFGIGEGLDYEVIE